MDIKVVVLCAMVNSSTTRYALKLHIELLGKYIDGEQNEEIMKEEQEERSIRDCRMF